MNKASPDINSQRYLINLGSDISGTLKKNCMSSQYSKCCLYIRYHYQNKCRIKTDKKAKRNLLGKKILTENMNGKTKQKQNWKRKSPKFTKCNWISIRTDIKSNYSHRTKSRCTGKHKRVSMFNINV